MPRSLATALVLISVLLGCRGVQHLERFGVRGGTPHHQVTNAFIEVVEEVYAGRKDGELDAPILGNDSARMEFRYNRATEQQAIGERIELRKTPSGDIVEKAKRGEYSWVDVTVLEGYTVVATYDKEGINPGIGGLAQAIARQVQARLDEATSSTSGE